MTKARLRNIAELSAGIISDVTCGRGNPSLDSMEQIADALETPLPELLETDLDDKSFELLTERKRVKLPQGYERISAILPAHQAFMVKKWAEAAKIKIENNVYLPHGCKNSHWGDCSTKNVKSG